MRSYGFSSAVLLLGVACGASTPASGVDSESGGPAGAAHGEPQTGGSNQGGSFHGSAGSDVGGQVHGAGSSHTAGDTNRAGSASRAGAGGASIGAGGTGAAGRPHPPVPPNPNCEEGVAPTPQLRRLSNEHYDRTVRDLLGVTQLGDSGPPSARLVDAALGLTVTEIESSAYASAAEAVAEFVMADAALRSRFLTCTPDGAADPCWQETILRFGRRAFRRPLSEPELVSFLRLVDDTKAIDANSKSLLTAFLTSPSFLIRSETGSGPDAQGCFRLSPHEIATRLSYMLWGSLPDAALDTAADTDMLGTEEQIIAQAERMLADAKARDQVASFHRTYRRHASWPPLTHDETLYPLFNARVASAMLEELERFFDAVVFEDRGSFEDLFSSLRGFVNTDTAPIYGLSPADFGQELAEVTLDPSQRPGFLTRGGFLASFSNYSTTSPIRRGVFVTNAVLGLTLAQPAPIIDPLLPPQDTFPTERAKITALTSAEPCSTCHHIYINPPGFVLEAYDAIGSWQTRERTTGAAIDTVADVFMDGALVTVADPADLMRRIAQSSDAQRTYAESWLAYAYERHVDPLDACTVDRLHYRIRQGNYPILDLLRDLAGTRAFGLRATQ